MDFLFPPNDSLDEMVRWACVLEASAPKVGNVTPNHSFPGLSYEHFTAAADRCSEELTRFSRPVSKRMHAAVSRTIQEVGTNVNLGIVLLFGPLVEAARRTTESSRSSIVEGCARVDSLRKHVAEVLEEFDPVDGQTVFSMIDLASQQSSGAATRIEDQPPKSHDVTKHKGHVELIEAMRLAADRDRIALQYSDGFRDLFESVFPIVRDHLHHVARLSLQRRMGDPSLLSLRESSEKKIAFVERKTTIQTDPHTLSGIAKAHLDLLSRYPDSLIARKRGLEMAREVQRRAAKVNANDPQSIADLDAWMRRDGNQLNPGTTADLIAGALFILLFENASIPT